MMADRAQTRDRALLDTPAKRGAHERTTSPSSLSVVIPALNEERGIDEILQRVLGQREELAKAGIRALEVIVVDDGSKDKTADRIRAYPDVRLIQHPTNRGYGAALKTGFKIGRASCRER